MKAFFSQMDTIILVSIPAFVGIVMGILWEIVAKAQFHNHPPGALNARIVGLIFLVWSLTFAGMIFRKEAPVRIRLIVGKWALLYGWIGFISCLFLGISLFVKSFFYR